MKECQDCKGPIEDNYIVCVCCARKRKEAKGNNEVVRALQQNNNNLYAIRTILEKFLYEKGHLLVWNKENKCFDIKKVSK